jgi:hypothetical protein
MLFEEIVCTAKAQQWGYRHLYLSIDMQCICHLAILVFALRLTASVAFISDAMAIAKSFMPSCILFPLSQQSPPSGRFGPLQIPSTRVQMALHLRLLVQSGVHVVYDLTIR